MSKQNLILHSLAGFIISFQIGSVWHSTFLPLQDYYEWLIQSKILFNLWTGDSFTQQYYSYSILPIPPPNTLVTVLMALLHFIFSTETVGKITLTTYVLLFNLGFYRWCQEVSGNNSLRFMGLFFVFNFFFYMGFLNYIIGVAILFWTLPIVTDQISPTTKKTVHILIASTVLYLVHGFVYGVFVIAVAIGLAKTYWRNFKFSHLLPYALAILPTVIISCIYFLNTPHSLSQSIGLFPSFHQMLNAIRYGITSYQRVVLFETDLPLTILNLLLIISACSIFISLRKQLRLNTISAWLFIAFSIIMLLNPVNRIGGFFAPVPRIIPIIPFVLAGAFVLPNPKPRLEFLILSISLLISLFHSFYLYEFNKQNRITLVQLKAEYTQANSPLVIGRVVVEDFDRSPLRVFSGIVQPYIRIGHFFNMDSITTFLPLQQTGVIGIKMADDTRTTVYLDSLFDLAQQREDLVETTVQLKNLIYARHDKVILFGKEITRNIVEEKLSPEFSKQNDLGFWSTLQRNSIPDENEAHIKMNK